MRVVSLLPSATEIVCALGAEHDLVGISHECDFPVGVCGLPVLTRARIDPHGSSKAIDAAVRTAMHDALSIYSVGDQKLAGLSPDVIITQDLCEVCAVSLDDVRAAVARLAHRTDIAIVSLRPTRLDDVWNDVETVARALGRDSRGSDVRRSLEERVEAIAARARRAVRKPRVVTIEWLEPIMLGGTWMPELIALAGGVAVGAEPGVPAPTVTEAELAALEPDVVVIKPCGFPIARTLEEKPLVDALANAVPRARVFISDGNAFFNRPGPRLLESLEILAACVHPELFDDFARKHRTAIIDVSPRGRALLGTDRVSLRTT